MAKQIDPIKKERYKRARLGEKGISKALCISKSLLEAGYSEKTAFHKQNDLKLVKVVEAELRAEFKASDVTVESVLRELEEIKQLAMQKKDYATAKECSIWKGKYLAMFTEKRIIEQHYIEPTERERKLTRLRTLIIRPISKETEKPIQPVVVENKDNEP